VRALRSGRLTTKCTTASMTQYRTEICRIPFRQDVFSMHKRSSLVALCRRFETRFWRYAVGVTRLCQRGRKDMSMYLRFNRGNRAIIATDAIVAGTLRSCFAGSSWTALAIFFFGQVDYGGGVETNWEARREVNARWVGNNP
jgi:hypothetical protein